MDSSLGMFFGFLIPVVAIGIVTFFVVALVQEGKTAGRGEAVKSAFSHVVSLVMLAIIVGASAFLLQEAFRSWVFTKAESTTRFSNPPPTLFLSPEKAVGGQVLYVCKDKCEFTDADREQLATWRESYSAWKQNDGAGSATVQQKRDIVNAVSFLLVAVPFFWWFFMRTIQREARKNREQGQRPGPLRSVYFYLTAFTGLIGLVVSGAMLINLGLKAALKIQNDTTNRPELAMVATEKNGVKSVVNCAEQCQFSGQDKQLAQEWLTDYDNWQTKNGYPRQTSAQTDLATLLPVMLVTAPLFLYHFITIRKESKDKDGPMPQSAA